MAYSWVGACWKRWPKLQTGPGGQGESTYAEKSIASGRILCDTYLSARVRACPPTLWAPGWGCSGVTRRAHRTWCGKRATRWRTW
jgi:hypothetical protein